MGLAVYALTSITALDFGINHHFYHQLIFFTAPFFAYNFIKFHTFFFGGVDHRIRAVGFLLGFVILGIFLFVDVGFYLPSSSWIILFFTLLLVLLYGFPLPGLNLNFRGFKGLKIHLVALSWVLTTVFLPLSLSGQSLNEFSLVYGWVEAMIQAHAYIKAGMAKKCLVIGADALSRVIDIYDRDSMIYADGAGATILEESAEVEY